MDGLAGRPHALAVHATSEGVAAATGELPFRARKGAGRSEPIPLLGPPWAEALLTRAHPALPFLVVPPVVAGLLDQTGPGQGLDLPGRSLALGAGALLWTWVEYAMHRWLFHPRLGQDTPPWRRFALLMVHGHHHLVPDDPHRLVATPVQLASLVGLVYGVLAAVVGPPWSGPMLAGFLLAYLAYEALHFRAHHRRPRSGLSRWLAAHHLRHHAGDGTRGFGISTPLWDLILGTGASPPRRP